MAEQISTIKFVGKVGNLVGFTNSASQKAGAVFVRQAAVEVYNPQTDGQARQRSRLKPALNFFSAFSSVLDSAFYPSSKNTKNRRFFMKHAMREETMSDVALGENHIPFLPYMVSRGFLGLDYLCLIQGEEQVSERTTFVKLGIKSQYMIEYDLPISTVSEWLLRDNPLMREGMQITFLIVTFNRYNDLMRQSHIISFVLDTKNTLETFYDIPNIRTFNFEIFNGDNDDGLFLSVAPHVDTNLVIGSIATIISAKTAKAWDYTNSYMQLTTRGEEIRASYSHYTGPSYQRGHRTTL